MLDISTDIKPLSTFKRDSVALIEQLKRTGRPIVLTINGNAEVVVQDAKSYQAMLELVERAEAVMEGRRGLATGGNGNDGDAAKAMEKTRKRGGVPRK